MNDTAYITALNRAAWNASAPLHGTGADWDKLCTLVAEGGSGLDATVTAALQDAGIAGARVVQVGCNNGREVLSAMALGAAGVGALISQTVFLRQPRSCAHSVPMMHSFCRPTSMTCPQTPRATLTSPSSPSAF